MIGIATDCAGCFYTDADYNKDLKIELLLLFFTHCKKQQLFSKKHDTSFM